MNSAFEEKINVDHIPKQHSPEYYRHYYLVSILRGHSCLVHLQEQRICKFKTIKSTLFIRSQIIPLTSKSDMHPTSPYDITPVSHIKVMRIKEMINNYRSS